MAKQNRNIGDLLLLVRFLKQMDKQHKKYYEFYTGEKWGKPENYDLCINSANYGPVSYTHLDVYKRQGWKNALQNTDWNWQEKRRRYWNSGGLPGTTEKQEERENQIPLTFLVSHFIAEWTERESFSVVG